MRLTTRRGVRRGVALAASAVLATTVLAGCGDDSEGSDDSNDSSSESTDGGDDEGGDAFADRDAQEILDAAEEATKGASSLRLAGEISSDGSEGSVDLVMGDQGCEGNITFDGLSVDILGVDGDVWYAPSEEFWRSQLSGSGADEASIQMLLAQVNGKWIADDSGEFSDFCDVATFFDDDDDDEEERNAEKGDVEDVDGTDAIAIDYDSDDGDRVTGYIAVDEPHYLLRIDHPTDGSLELSEYDEDVSFEAPAPDEIVDLDALAG